MIFDLLHRRSQKELPNSAEVDQTSPEYLRAQRMNKLINQLISLEVDQGDVQPIIEALRAERDQKIAAACLGLDNLVVLKDKHPQEEDSIKSLLGDTADLILGDFTESEHLVQKGGVGISVVYSALNAWDKARNESTSALCERALNDFPGVARLNLDRAYNHATTTGITFNDALYQVNQADILTQERIEANKNTSFHEVLDEVFRLESKKPPKAA